MKILCFLVMTAGLQAATYYISPAGSDANSCTAAQSITEPKKTFAAVFACGTGGDTFELLDGSYTSAATGMIHWDTSSYGTGSAEAPSGISAGTPTVVKAHTEGAVKILGPVYVGRSATAYQYITFRGITWESTYNVALIRHASYIVFQRCGFHGTVVDDQGGVLNVGLGDDTWPSVNHVLIEDCWVWGKARAMALAYWGTQIIFRRVVVRGDECTGCTSQPNVGITVYASSYVSLQNVLVVDRLIGDAYAYGDFAAAAHSYNFDPALYVGNEWLGCISMNSAESGTQFDPDSSGTMTFRNMVIWNPGTSGFNAQVGSGGAGATFDVQYATIYLASATATDGLRLANVSGTVRNVAVGGAGTRGYVSYIIPEYFDIWGTWSNGTYYYSANACVTGCLTSSFLADTGPSVLFPVRIEAGSTLAAAGYNGEYGTRIGADVTKKYGTAGTNFGTTGYNTLTADALWPWPYQDRIKKEMCTDSSITRGFCSATTLTQYIMNQLSNGDPYGSSIASWFQGGVNFTGAVTVQ